MDFSATRGPLIILSRQRKRGAWRRASSRHTSRNQRNTPSRPGRRNRQESRSKLSKQSRPQPALLFTAQLRSARRKIENVNRGLPFRINQRNFDIAFLTRELRADAIEQAGLVLRNHLNQCAVRRTRVIKMNLRLYFHLRRAILFGSQAIAQHPLEIELPQ